MKSGLIHAFLLTALCCSNAFCEEQVETRTADQVVQRYLRLTAEREWQSLDEVLHFSNEAHRKHYQNVVARLKQISKPTGPMFDLKKDVHCVEHPKDLQGGTYLYLVPGAAGYFPKEFELVLVPEKGMKVEYPKLEFESVADTGSNSLTAQEKSRKTIEATIREWQAYQGDFLTYKATRYKESARLRVEAFTYAEKNGLKINESYGSKQIHLKFYESIKKLSPEGLKKKVLAEMEDLLKAQG